MSQTLKQLNVPLSQLVPGRNPRKVKPSREAHKRLLALVRSQGLLQPLVVRRLDAKHYEVVAGERRLRVLREVHRGEDPKIPCVLRDVDDLTAESMSLGENFGREAMHPLDEAEAFAKLASSDGKDAEAIGAEFGVEERYVRQRMKLSILAQPIKAAFRTGGIDTAIAQAFAAVPPDRQLAVWQELQGNPRHAEHVRNVIAHAWIDAEHAAFDLSELPESAVSRDLFGDRTLVERQAFMEAQAKALEDQRHALTEDGWAEVVVARREDVQDRLYAMNQPEREFDEATSHELAKIEARREKLDDAAEEAGHDEDKLRRLRPRYEKLEADERAIIERAPAFVSEETKAVASTFLILDPDGRVHREVRMPRVRASGPNAGKAAVAGGEAVSKPAPPTSDDLTDGQLAVSFTHQAVAVREALLKDAAARKRVLAVVLHEKVRCEALAVRHEPNGTTLHASDEEFRSPAFDRMRKKREQLDPLGDVHFVEDRAAYERIGSLTPAKLDALLEVLVVDCLTAHLQRPTELVRHLAVELKVNVREDWAPDATWLAGFQKSQLAHLIVELRGPVHAPAPERKKTELVELLAKLFAEAAEGKLADKELADLVNTWLPACLREQRPENRNDTDSRART